MNSCYVVPNENKDWGDAQKICKRKFTANLVAITSQQENDFIMNNILAGKYN